MLLASSLLTREPEPTKEKGYVSVLYAGIKRCIADHHVHLPAMTDYIGTLIGRAQPELMGRYTIKLSNIYRYGYSIQKGISKET